MCLLSTGTAISLASTSSSSALPISRCIEPDLYHLVPSFFPTSLLACLLLFTFFFFTLFFFPRLARKPLLFSFLPWLDPQTPLPLRPQALACLARVSKSHFFPPPPPGAQEHSQSSPSLFSPSQLRLLSHSVPWPIRIVDLASIRSDLTRPRFSSPRLSHAVTTLDPNASRPSCLSTRSLRRLPAYLPAPAFASNGALDRIGSHLASRHLS